MKGNIYSRQGAYLLSTLLVLMVVIVGWASEGQNFVANATDQQTADTTYTADIQPVDTAQVTGTAEFTPQENQLHVHIQAEGLEPNVEHPQHIHTGTCDSPGEVVLPLETEEGGFPTADEQGMIEYENTFEQMMDNLGDHIVLLHSSDGSHVACGDINEGSGDTLGDF